MQPNYEFFQESKKSEMNYGWFKLYRELFEHWIFQSDDKYLKWWLTILIKVNHAESKLPVGDKIHTCFPGQSFRSLDNWASLFGCSKKTVVKFFLLLKNDSMIEVKTIGSGNRRKHLLTVVNWQKYQQTETENYSERKPKTTLNGNPTLPPNKNDKNVKNEKNDISEKFELFRKKYPAAKGGLKTELDNFLKKNNPETVNLLLPALEKEINHKKQLEKAGEFCPQWKNLTTWINKKCWEQELPEVNESNFKSNNNGSNNNGNFTKIDTSGSRKPSTEDEHRNDRGL